ncbi:insulinase family protein [Opitutales bacterium]|nr:insulinase family protein [Opitutales bacterium]
MNSCSTETSSSISLPDTNEVSQSGAKGMEVIQKTLSNGLTIYISPNTEEPRFYAEIITRAGSKHDPATNTGLAHYLEHLLFKGTQSFGTLNFEKEKPYLDQITKLYEERSKESNETKRSEIYKKINQISTKSAEIAIPNEMDRVYSDMGAKGINAHTWHEETVYKVDLPSNRLAHWAKIESNRFTEPVFRLFHTELETVYEEKNRSIDNKDRLLHRVVNDLLFKSHPYGQQSTLGTVDHLKNPSITAIEDFFAKHYVPENMAICISGDIDPDQAIKIIEENFSTWKNQESLREEPSWEEDPLKGREFVQVQYLGEEQVLLAFRTAPRFHEDYSALRLIDMILDNSVAGLVNLNLVNQQKVRAAGCFPINYNDYGAHYFMGSPKDDQTLEEVEKLLLEQVEMVKAGKFDEWILPAVINDFKKRHKEDLESNSKRVELMRDAFLAFIDWNKMDNQIADLEKVTKEEIIRVANKYYGNDYVVGFRIDAQHDLPSIDKPSIDPLKINPDKESDFMRSVTQIPHQPFTPKFIQEGNDYRVISISEKIQLVHAANPLNDLFAMEVRMEIGNDHQPMLTLAKRMLDRAGAEQLSSEQLKIEWYKLATEFGFGVGEHFSTFSINGLDENLEESLELARKHLLSPSINENTWSETKSIILSERDDEQKDPRALSNALAHFHRYGIESRYLKRPSDSDLNASSVDSLTQLLTSLFDVKRTVLYYGPRSVEEVTTSIKNGFLGSEPSNDSPAIKPNRSLSPDANQVFFLQKEMAQAQVRLEFSVGTYNEKNAPVGQLFNEYFGGGMAGLVFQELREARALAYSAWAHYFSPSRPEDENILVGAIGCQADKTLEAVNAFIELLDNMPINETRWNSAHTAILSSYRTNPISSRSIPGFVYDFNNLGLAEDPRSVRYESLQTSKINSLREFYEEEIQPKSILLSIVGDSNKIDLEELKKIGPVTEIQPEQLFNR